MSENGAEVLSEHVAARNKAEMDQMRAKNTGHELPEIDPWFEVRRQDLAWVDEATHVVALVNAPSHGVGVEIEHAILKPRLGLNETPILCLVDEQLKDKTSFMIRGVSEEECPVFSIETYDGLDSATESVKEFLLKYK